MTAIGEYTSALEKEPANISVLRQRGEARRSIGSHNEAILDFDAALSIAPQFAEALAGRGACKRALGKLEEAISDFNAALAFEPDNAATLLERCSAFRAKGRTQDALRDLDAVLKIDPRNAGALQLRGEMRRKTGELRAAMLDFNCALELEPRNVAALAGRGAAQRALGRLSGALADFDAAWKLEPQNAAVLTGRGTVKLELGNCQESLADFKAALKIQPEDAFAKWGQQTSARQGWVPPRKVSLTGFQTANANNMYVERRQPQFCVHDRETYWSVAGDVFLYWCMKESRWKGSRAQDLKKIQTGASCAFLGAPFSMDLFDRSLIKGWHEWDGKEWSLAVAAGVDDFGSEGAPARALTLSGFVGDALNARYLEVRQTKFTIGGKETFWSEDRGYFLFWCRNEKRWKGSRATDFLGNREGASKAIIAAPVNADLLSPSLIKGWHEWDGNDWRTLKLGGVSSLSVLRM